MHARQEFEVDQVCVPAEVSNQLCQAGVFPL